MDSREKQRSEYYAHHCYSPIKMFSKNSSGQSVFFHVTCGRCKFCLKAKQSDWVNRMILHTESFRYLYYVTLTYDKEFLQDSPQYVRETHAVKTKDGYLPLVLCRPHLQDFFKRLRKFLNFPISNVYCGEYGTNKGRCHYHILVWSNSEISKDVFQSAWSLNNKPIGFIDYQRIKYPNSTVELSDNTFKYVSKYITKSKLSDFKKTLAYKLITSYYNEEFYKKNYDKIKPFFGYSKRPAIGELYYKKHMDSINIEKFQVGLSSGKTITIPHSFRIKSRQLEQRYLVSSIFSANYSSNPNSFNSYVFSVYYNLLHRVYYNSLQLSTYKKDSTTQRKVLAYFDFSSLQANFKIKDTWTNIIYHYDFLTDSFYHKDIWILSEDFLPEVYEYLQKYSQTKRDLVLQKMQLADELFKSNLNVFFTDREDFIRFFNDLENNDKSNFQQAKEVF